MRMVTKCGTEFCRSMEHYLASLVDKRDFVGAIKHYEASRGEIDAVGDGMAGSVLRQVARAYSSSGNQTAALKIARKAQRMITEEGDSISLAELFITLGSILQSIGESKEAEKAFRDSESIFRRNDNSEGQCRALNLLAGLFFKQNDYRNSLTVLMDAIGIARKLGDRRKLAFMMGNIGRIHTFTGNFSEALNHLQINLDLSDELADEVEIVRAHLSIAYLHIQQADYGKAEDALKLALPLIKQLSARREEVIYLTYLGELSYLSGRLDEGRKALERAIDLAEAVAPGATLGARAMRHMAELLVLKNNHRHARRYVSRAMVIMKEAGIKAEIGALRKLKGMIAEADGRRSEGRDHFVKALGILDESGVRFEKVGALIASGRSQLFNQRQRLVYLFRAEEYFTRVGLKTRLQEVERLIDSLESTTTSTPIVAGVMENMPEVGFLTECQVIKRFIAQIDLLGRADLPVLLTGETGVGKDHMARYYHNQVRPNSPFVAINCASVPDTLLESELFGHTRGAFTGADRDKTGLFVAASGGVLFLDEIGDMPITLQTKLLGVLERRKVLPLGSTSEIEIDIKLVAATNRELDRMVEEGNFRRDLYYRLSGITFKIPPLRERKQDIPLLLNYFLAESHLGNGNSPLPPELMRQFLAYDWPGNTRELHNKVKRLELMVEMVAEGDLAELIRSLFATDPPPAKSSLFERVEQFERDLIHQAILATDGNKSEAARLLGIHEATVRTKLKRYGITA